LETVATLRGARLQRVDEIAKRIGIATTPAATEASKTADLTR